MMKKTHLPNTVIGKVLEPKMQDLIIKVTERNPRDVKRFINSIVISHEIYGHDVNVKDLSFEEAFDIIDKWLCKCNDIEKLDFDTETKVNDYLKSAVGLDWWQV